MNKRNQKIIEDSEAAGIPVFVFTAKDKLSTGAILDYKSQCMDAGCGDDFIDEIAERVEEFAIWQEKNPELVKLPD